MTTTELGLGQERLEANEEAIIDQIVKLNLSTVDRNTKPIKRGQHPKHHGLVEAQFIVSDDLSDDFRHGLFANPGSYKALIRFSNGMQDDDRKADVHGMAIKVLSVPGKRALETGNGDTAQDFILLDHEVFFSRNVKNFVSFNRRRVAASRSLFSMLLLGASLFILERPLKARLNAFLKQTHSSPLASNYWSTTAYRLGPNAVKYMAKSLQHDGGQQRNVDTADGLSVALVEALSSGLAKFDFGVHLQTDPVLHPVEDPTVNWSANGAKFTKLATIEIGPQNVDPKSESAEQIKFSPWHALEEHRPLGAINRARKSVYRAMAAARANGSGS